MDNSIQSALQNLIDNKASAKEIGLLWQAATKGEIAIHIDGNVQNSVIIVGNDNTVTLTKEASDKLRTEFFFFFLAEVNQLA